MSLARRQKPLDDDSRRATLASIAMRKQKSNRPAKKTATKATKRPAKKPAPKDELVSRRELARRLSLNATTIAGYIDRGIIPTATEATSRRAS